MLFSREIEDLHDDGFEGSINELRTSQKLYFGNDGDSRGSKKCFVTGVISFERDYSKDSYVSLCSNSGNSDITNQEDPYDVKEQSYDVNVKRMKLSADELSGAKPYLQKVLNSSAPLNRVVSGGSQPASKCSASSLDGSEEKDNLLVSSSAVVTIESGSRRISKPRWKDSCFIELDEAEMSSIKNSPNDPRPVLRYHINRLFKASGWAVGRRKRSNTYNGIGEYVYKSPEGRPIREFRRAWILCGQSLFTDSNNVLQESDGKHWTNLSHFWADLSNTSTEINGLDNSETSTALLAHCWYLLDPFAKAVFIDRTFSCLKGGKVTKAKRSLLMDSSYTNGAVGSSLVSDCALTIFDPDYSSIRQDRCGRGHFVSPEHLHRVPVKVLCEEDYLCSSYKLSGPNFREISSSERSSLDPFSLQDYGSDSSSDPIGNDLFEVPIHTEDENVYGGKPEYFIDNGGSDRILKNSYLCSAQQRNAKKQLRFKKFNHLSGNSEKFVYANNNGKHPGFSIKQKKPRFCGGNASYNDDDLLISAIIKPKSFISTTKGSKRVRCKSKPLRKHKSRRGSCRLLPRSKGGPHHTDGVRSAFGSRTILSWLINSGVISINEGIQYRNKKDDAVVKHGLVTWHGILCRCCDSVLSMSEFKRHAGFRLYHGPCLNLFMESGKPFTLCQLEAWSAEYRARKRVTRTVQVYEMDDSDDSCGLCGGGGELICCDNCPSTFHQACLHLLELPEGSWYCWHCTCQVCGDVVDDKDAANVGVLKCLQCEHKYHETCMKEKGGLKAGAASDFWLCGESCQQIYSGLHSRVGLMNLISGGLSWTLLRCIHGDKKVHSAQRLVALKAECNIKLAVALTIMEECFLPMVDTRTGIDMIPHVLYNWGSQFARLNYHGFYTVVLEKNDVVMSVASIRIHGATVAEMPLIATCNKYRRQGMCRHLMNAIEEMLRSVKVEKLVISAIPDLVETWTVCFGFKQLDDNERRSLNTVNLMVFPGTVWLKKSFSYNHQVAAEQPVGSCHASPPGTDDLAKSRVHSEDHITELAQQPEGNFCTEEVDADTEIRGPTDNNIQAVKDQDEDLNDQFLKLSCEGTAANKLELVCHVGTIEVYTDKLLPFTEQPDKFSLL